MALGPASTLLLFLLPRLLLVAIATCWSFAIPLASCVGQCGIAAGDVHILAVVRHMLQGELGSIAGAQAHGASSSSQGGAPISSFTGRGQDHGLQHLCVELVVGPGAGFIAVLGAAGAWSLGLRETPVRVGRGLQSASPGLWDHLTQERFLFAGPDRPGDFAEKLSAG